MKVKKIVKCANFINEDVANTPKKKKSLVEKPVYGLKPQHDSRKSFNNKANVEIKDDGTKILYSYDTPVCFIDKEGKLTLGKKWDTSATTLRHVKEFLKQNGFKVESKAQMEKDYEVKELGEGLETKMTEENEKVKFGEGDERELDRASDVEVLNNFETIAKRLTKNSMDGIRYNVEVTYLDYGQDWKWTTIIAYDDREDNDSVFHSWQVLNPRDWKLIANANGNVELDRIYKDIANGKYFDDKMKDLENPTEVVDESIKNKKYVNQTSQGWKIYKIFADNSFSDTRYCIIANQGKHQPDLYVIGLGYSFDTGGWSQGRYDYRSVEDAEKALKKGYKVTEIPFDKLDETYDPQKDLDDRTIDRKGFVTLVRLGDNAWEGYSILNDNNFVTRVYAKDDEDAKRQFNIFVNKNKRMFEEMEKEGNYSWVVVADIDIPLNDLKKAEEEGLTLEKIKTSYGPAWGGKGYLVIGSGAKLVEFMKKYANSNLNLKNVTLQELERASREPMSTVRKYN